MYSVIQKQFQNDVRSLDQIMNCMFRSAAFLFTQPAITRVRNNRIETFYGPTLLDVPAPVCPTDLQPVFFFHYGSFLGGRSSYGRTLFLHGVVTWCLVGKNYHGFVAARARMGLTWTTLKMMQNENPISYVLRPPAPRPPS